MNQFFNSELFTSPIMWVGFWKLSIEPFMSDGRNSEVTLLGHSQACAVYGALRSAICFERKEQKVQVLRSDASEVAAGCRADCQALAKRLVKLTGRKDAAERREVRGQMRRLAKEEKRRQSAAVAEVSVSMLLLPSSSHHML
jgi:hypothetical protein